MFKGKEKKKEKLRNITRLINKLLLTSIFVTIIFFIYTIVMYNKMNVDPTTLSDRNIKTTKLFSYYADKSSNEKTTLNKGISYRNLVKIDSETNNYGYYENQFRINYPNDLAFIKTSKDKYVVYTSDNAYYKKVLGISSGDKIRLTNKKIKEYEKKLNSYDNIGNKLSDKERNKINKLYKLRYIEYIMFIVWFLTLIIMVYDVFLDRRYRNEK